MKILLIITGLGVGGAERQVCDLADKLQFFGYEVLIISMTANSLIHPLDKSIKIINFDINKKNVFSYFIGIIKLRKIIKKFHPDILHSHMIHANIFSRISSIGFNKRYKLISTAHSKNEGGALRMLAYRITDFLADISTNVSQEAVEEFEKRMAVPSGKMIAIHNGIDINKFSLNKDVRINYREKFKIRNEKIFLAVGRLVEAKDYPNLLRAFSLLYKKHQCKLMIVGDGPLKNDLIVLSEELKIENYVEFLGIREDINSLMNAADYFVLSSAWEGFGLVVAEAMATEKIVIATDCGGVAEVVGDAGILVEPKNYISLAQAMENVINMSEIDANIIRKKARIRVVEKYSLDIAVDKWINLYKNI